MKFLKKIGIHSVFELPGWAMFLIGSLLGLLTFGTVYGFDVINIFNDKWLINFFDQDIALSYANWMVFRNSPWHWMFGRMEGLTFEPISVIYAEMINTPAYLFKIFAPFLPARVQYIGIHQLICLMLQGGLGALIIRRFSKNTFVVILGALGFIFTTPYFQRAFLHTTLAAQYAVLLPFLIWLYKDRFTTIKQNIIIWSLLMINAVLCQSYFLVPVGVMFFFYLLEDLIVKKDWKFPFSIGMSTSIIFLLFAFLFGFFMGDVTIGSDPFGALSSNLNSLFNSIDWHRASANGPYWSDFLTPLPIAAHRAQHASVYLGLGFIIGLLIILVGIYSKGFKEVRKNWSVRHYCILGAAFTVFVLSLGKEVYLGTELLFEIPYPRIVLKILNGFRAPQRFTTMPLFFLVAVVYYFILKLFPLKKAIVLLVFCVAIQIIDLKNQILSYGSLFQKNATKVVAAEPLSAPVWKDIGSQYKHIVFLGRFSKIGSDVPMISQLSLNYFSLKALQSLVWFAGLNKMSTSEAYIVRWDIKSYLKGREQAWQAIDAGEGDETTVYIFENNKIPREFWDKKRLFFYQAEEYIVGVKTPLSKAGEGDLTPIITFPSPPEPKNP